MAITLVLADDHAIVRQGLRTLLESDPDLTVVGEAADGREAIELVKRRKPALLIADLIMPGLNGLDVARKLRRMKSSTRVIMLSMYRDEAYVLEAMNYGVSAYVAKEAGGAELFEAIREAVAGRRFISPAISDSPIDTYASSGTILQRDRGAVPDPYHSLTVRQRQVLQLLVEGATDRDLGHRLKIGSRAVETHCATLIRKLRLSTRPQLVRYALQRGVMPRRGADTVRPHLAPAR